VIFRPGDRDVTVVFPLREERNFAVDGLGYLTPDNQLAGSITATLRNIFGSGERFQFDWQRANETSSRLLLKSTIPRIFATPLDAGIELQQRDRDSSFISTSARLTFLYHLSYDWSVSTSFGSSKITPEVQQLTDAARVLAVDLRTLYDNRVEKRHPRRGVVVEYSFQSSYRREFPAAGGAVSGYSRRLAGELTFYQSLSRDLVWRQRVAAFQAASDFEPLPIDELIEVGGPESIRGYRDNSFIAKLGALANSEMRWYALENLTLLAFTDNGVIRTEDVELGLTGFGAGILIDTSLGEFRFEAALGEGKSLDQMLVHFGFTGEL
jgi:outer membrane protein assembly factor BamA